MLNIKPKMNDNTRGNRPQKSLLLGVFLLSSALVLSACGGGASNSETPGNSGDGGGSGGGFVYTGAASRNTTVTNFQTNLFNFIAADNVCAQCHAAGGQGTGEFANPDDVNAAYDEAVMGSRVNLADPAASSMVTKFRSAGGHFCWLSTDEECAQRLETWIANWRDAENGSSERSISLIPPNSAAPEAALSFPGTAPASFTAVHNLVSTHCINCHVPSPANPNQEPQSPYFAQSNIATSYQIISENAGLINLANTTGSRLHVRLNTDSHNCWDVATDAVVAPNCTESASLMLAAIDTMRAELVSDGSQVDLSTLTESRAVSLIDDGIVAAGGNRYEANLIALYEFKERSGNTIADSSSLAPAADLILRGTEGVDYQRLSSWGVRFMHDTPTEDAVAHSNPPANTTKVATAIRASGEYSFEMWVIPDNVAQTDRTIVSYSTSSTERNANVSQYGYEYQVMHTTNNSGNLDGIDTMIGTDENAELLQASLQHVVVTYDAQNGRKVYINGVDSGVVDPEPTAGLSDWNENYSLTLGNSFNGDRAWRGVIKMLAIHDRAMTLEQVQQNFNIDVGQKYFLMFDVSAHISTPACQGPDVNTADDLPYAPLCFVYAEAAQFDDFSYLINQPKFVSLHTDPTVVATLQDLPIKGMRIGVNGREAESGQAFVAIDTQVNIDGSVTGANLYDAGEGQLLSDLGAIVALEFGPVASPPDRLFLTFEVLGNATDRTAQYNQVVTPSIPDANPELASDVQIRSFEEINTSMSQITGVSRTTNAIVSTYNSVVQGLPGTANVENFVPAQQIAIAQLAIEYCNALIDDNGTTIAVDSYFPDISMGTVNSTGLAFTRLQQNALINPLLERVNNVTFNNDATVTTDATVDTALATQGSTTTIRDELKLLVGELTATGCGGATCTPARTVEIMKATCAAAVASAGMLVQ